MLQCWIKLWNGVLDISAWVINCAFVMALGREADASSEDSLTAPTPPSLTGAKIQQEKIEVR